MMTRPNIVVTSSETTNPSKSDLRTSKLRSLLPKNLLNQTSKSHHVQADSLQEMNDPGTRSSLHTNTNAFQVGEIVMAQAGEEVRSLHEGSVASSSETMVHFNGPSPSHVVALTEAQLQKLLAMTPTEGVGKSQVLHMVAIEEGSEPQPLSMSLEDAHLPLSLEDHPVSIVEESAGLEVNALSVTSAPSHQSVSVAHQATNTSLNLPETMESSVQAAQKIHSVCVPKRSSNSETHISDERDSERISDNSPTKSSTQDKDKDVVKKTMVEAFVKMVVCRKVTVQTVNQTSGEILDTKVKLEEEEPVI
ncbi:hypothetical protein EGW08_009349 [Elysia chlorotica]|uniref:Uncharacterized protein n=1 Tax=Elysia chlorotica TaxID=188477 RepID=A0A3S1HNC8_ELYCH|nr:hypothetical protein EGW08_009349 [Elysia chlorotica]